MCCAVPPQSTPLSTPRSAGLLLQPLLPLPLQPVGSVEPRTGGDEDVPSLGGGLLRPEADARGRQRRLRVQRVPFRAGRPVENLAPPEIRAAREREGVQGRKKGAP